MKIGKNIKIETDVRVALKSLGFTDYFTNIYAALLDSGEMNAHELSKLTRVPYSRIYEVLNDMVKRGIITKLEGRPSTFIGNDPTEVFGSIKKKQENEFQLNMDTSLPYLKQLFGEKSSAKKEQLTIYEGNRASTDHFRNVLNGTNRTIRAFIKNMNEIFPIIKMNLDFLRAKGIETQLVIEERFRERSFTKTLKKYGTIRFYSDIIQGVLISDEKAGIQLIKGNFNIAKPKELEYSIFSSNSTSYITFLIEMFDRIWEKSVE